MRIGEVQPGTPRADATSTDTKPCRSARPAAVAWRRPAGELVLAVIFILIYEEIRGHMVQAGTAAANHALLIVSGERALGLFHERTVQTAFLKVDSVMDVFNAYYGGTHFLVPAGTLAWLMLRHPERYARSRTVLAVTTGVAFACFWFFPVAPPRLLPGRFGILDTLVAVGRSGHVETALINTAGDKYAAMPSLHVAWAVWCALALYPVVRRWALRALVAAYPVMTTLVVVATGNHFFFDAVSGALLACATWIAVTRMGRVATWVAAQAHGSTPLLRRPPPRCCSGVHHSRA